MIAGFRHCFAGLTSIVLFVSCEAAEAAPASQLYRTASAYVLPRELIPKGHTPVDAAEIAKEEETKNQALRRDQTAAADRILGLLLSAREVELLTLQPSESAPTLLQADLVGSGRAGIQGTPIKKRATMADPESLQRLVDAIKAGLLTSPKDNPDSMPLARHALRWVSNGKTYVFIADFRYGLCEMYEVGSEENHAELMIAPSPEIVFDRFFAAHGLAKVP